MAAEYFSNHVSLYPDTVPLSSCLFWPS